MKLHPTFGWNQMTKLHPTFGRNHVLSWWKPSFSIIIEVVHKYEMIVSIQDTDIHKIIKGYKVFLLWKITDLVNQNKQGYQRCHSIHHKPPLKIWKQEFWKHWPCLSKHSGLTEMKYTLCKTRFSCGKKISMKPHNSDFYTIRPYQESLPNWTRPGPYSTSPGWDFFDRKINGMYKE